MYKSEKSVIDVLQPVASNIHNNVSIRVVKSTQSETSLTRDVTFLILVPIENLNRDIAISALNSLSISEQQKENIIYFSGSESGLLHGDHESDWLFMTAKIQGETNGS